MHSQSCGERAPGAETELAVHCVAVPLSHHIPAGQSVHSASCVVLQAGEIKCPEGQTAVHSENASPPGHQLPTGHCWHGPPAGPWPDTQHTPRLPPRNSRADTGYIQGGAAPCMPCSHSIQAGSFGSVQHCR
eukprot:51851-Rhodomonas_salina.4